MSVENRFKVGDSVIAVPEDNDIFQNEFLGTVKAVKSEKLEMLGVELTVYSVEDSEGDVFDVYEEQLSLHSDE